MQIKRIFLGIVIAITLNSCMNTIDGNGNVVNEKRTVSTFSKIDISGGFEVLLNQGNSEKVELEVDENLIELIETKVKGNTLYISSEEPIGNAESLKIFITVVDVEDIDASGAIELKNKGTYQAENLEIDISGAADIDLDVDVENLTMDMSGASETTLAGTSNNFEIKISGAGELDAKKMKARNTSIDISGAGSAIVNVKKKLKVDVSGAGSVQYKGNPKIEKSISGAGSIKQL
ncbi:MAG: head GIN domain-containing protein [Vicingaceae bacterium]